MARMGSFSASGMKDLQRKMEKLQKDEMDAFCESCVKALAAQLLRLVMEKTPVGNYDGPVEFDANLPARQVEFNTKDGKHVSFHAKAQTKHVQFESKTGKQGGTLRRGWIAETHEEAARGEGDPGDKEILQYTKSLKVRREGDMLIIDIVNPVEYAAYVEYGHRTANHKGWVSGKLMLTKSEGELEQTAPGALKKKLTRFLRGHLS